MVDIANNDNASYYPLPSEWAGECKCIILGVSRALYGDRRIVVVSQDR